MLNSCTRSSQASEASPFPPTPTFPIPDKGRRMFIPASDGLLEPVDDLLSRLGVLTGEGTPNDDALQRLGHVEPGARERGIERQNATLQEPTHHVVRQMPRQVIPDQDQP